MQVFRNYFLTSPFIIEKKLINSFVYMLFCFGAVFYVLKLQNIKNTA